ncbi:uncharacterized protein BJ212DRAFT_1485062 [Suillus subaureus]|uniref:Uncharacterized protein n=1 Tax=Suillus subaureus TaxID=48587 RepID=A0A9P7J8C2_9AGAM|nr:uncharacterized protein BJ212DRAFT_1485062 [Suillus subaureus]KAG1808419.1 hypothetical protein BJ212DRAFT_1485062 [Suillus subaureus]
MSYPYPLARQNAQASSYSTLSGALDPAPAQSMYCPVRPNATPDEGIPISQYLRAQASAIPDLSGALGPAPHQYAMRSQAPVYAGAPVTTYSAVPHTLSGNYEGSFSARPAYPYPERNVLHPAKYTANMPPAAHKKTYKIVIPSGFHQLPQPIDIEKCAGPTSWSRIGSQHAGIKFNRKGGGSPFRVDELIELEDKPEVEGGHDQVFNGMEERCIKVLITWPGYSQYPVERRVSTENGTFKRERLLKLLAKYVEELVHDIHRRSRRVEKGYEKYELAWRPRGLPSIWRDCLITSLVHISGSNWQVELYVRA